MRIIMVPGLCSNEHSNTGGSFCESCFASFLLHGCAPDRACITSVVDDGKDETTLVLRYGGRQKVVTITEDNRETLAYGGWHGWIRFVEELPSTTASEPA